jgi:glycosyltransferase involved in cell wall biosynthesis
MTAAFPCQLDHLVVSPEAMFGFGWALPPRASTTRVWLDLEFADEPPQRVAVSIDRPREDVAAAFPDNPAAATAGFMLLAGWPGLPPVAATLAFEDVDGGCETIPLALPPLDAPRRPAGIGWRYLAARAWAHLRLGRLRTALHKYRELRRRTRANVVVMPADDFTVALRGRPVTLIVDHSMGGGANTYRDHLIAALTATGIAVVLLTFTVSALSLTVELHEAGHSPRAATRDTLAAVFDMLKGIRPSRLVYNCGVSFPRGLELCQLLQRLAERSAARLEVAIHDSYPICPSAFLLDDHGEFCGVPDRARCRECLPNHADGFVSLAGCRSIDTWRDAWGSLLRRADHIRCFSDSSQTLLARAYPDLAPRVTVQPHDVPPLPPVRRRPRHPSDPLVVGVIGSISLHKGAGVVADLARAIAADSAPVRIVVVGHVDAACPPEVVQQTGGYRRDDLPELCARHALDIVLLPSICPETFSFVAHEVLTMGLPLVAFDLGAPADLARAHPLGHVALRRDGPGLLAEIRGFAASLTDPTEPSRA